MGAGQRLYIYWLQQQETWKGWKGWKGWGRMVQSGSNRCLRRVNAQHLLILVSFRTLAPLGGGWWWGRGGRGGRGWGKLDRYPIFGIIGALGWILTVLNIISDLYPFNWSCRPLFASKCIIVRASLLLKQPLFPHLSCNCRENSLHWSSWRLTEPNPPFQLIAEPPSPGRLSKHHLISDERTSFAGQIRLIFWIYLGSMSQRGYSGWCLVLLPSRRPLFFPSGFKWGREVAVYMPPSEANWDQNGSFGHHRARWVLLEIHIRFVQESTLVLKGWFIFCESH